MVNNIGRNRHLWKDFYDVMLVHEFIYQVAFWQFSGIVVKCHQSRSLSENRKKARELLLAELDIQINGEDSLNAQMRRIDKKRKAVQDYKRKKLAVLKKAWKEREGID